jgi:hypothetical protein
MKIALIYICEIAFYIFIAAWLIPYFDIRPRRMMISMEVSSQQTKSYHPPPSSLSFLHLASALQPH